MSDINGDNIIEDLRGQLTVLRGLLAKHGVDAPPCPHRWTVEDLGFIDYRGSAKTRQRLQCVTCGEHREIPE